MRPDLTRRTVLTFGAAAALSGCGPRGAFLPVDPTRPAVTRRIVAATNRTRVGAVDGVAGRGRALGFSLLDIATPPNRSAGQLAFTGPEAFTLAASRPVSPDDLGRALRATVQTEGAGRDRLMLWIHGFNNTPAEAVHRQVQIVQDVGHAGAAISFVWPSAGRARAYVHDRDSVLHARDALSDLLIRLRAAWPGEIVVIAHSLGAFLTMEALGRLARSGTAAPPVDGLILVQPDIAPDLFEAQIRTIGTLPSQSALVISRNDPVLRLSARLSQQAERVGATGDRARFEAMGLSVIDLTAVGDANVRHLVAFTSPSVLASLKRLIEA